MVSVHGSAYTRGIRLAFVASRAPLGFLTNKLIIDPATARTDWQVVENVVLFGATTVLTNIVGMVPNSEFGFWLGSTRFKIGPDAIQFAHFELKFRGTAPPWPGKNLFFL